MDLVEEGFERALKGVPRIFGEFKNFITKGSALDLAIGVVIGAAFNGVVQSLVKDLITPLVSIVGRADFNDATACLKSRVVRGALQCVDVFKYGSFVTTLIAFVITAAAVFFFVVLPLNRLRERRRPAPSDRPCPFCTSTISLRAVKCPFCTADLEGQTPSAPTRLGR